LKDIFSRREGRVKVVLTGETATLVVRRLSASSALPERWIKGVVADLPLFSYKEKPYDEGCVWVGYPPNVVSSRPVLCTP